MTAAMRHPRTVRAVAAAAALLSTGVDADSGAPSRIELGHAVFNTQWVPAGTAGAARRDGLGPLFNASACDACHNEGAHGRGPTGDGDAPTALVIQLDVGRQPGRGSSGDPRYGHTLNTAAIAGFVPEGRVTIRYDAATGHYPDGAEWHLRKPRYVLSQLQRGPLSPRTVVQPRLAPALFGIGAFERVLDAPPGRFGWQGASTSVRDQTTKAFSHDMGLTTGDRPADDCTASETECRAAANGGTPEVAQELLEAVVEFQLALALPARAPQPLATTGPAAALFASTGCAACHRPTLRTDVGTIAPYTDLSLHDLGSRLADRDAVGRTVPTRWRTAPLWGMAYRLQTDREHTFLHDGRARSIEEAILWHDGAAALAKRRFVQLTPERRSELLRWIGSL
jgi:CxxC motif-containing protein (DUF1111 family)